MSTPATSERCVHDLLPGQCGVCIAATAVKPRKRAVTATARVRRLAAALRAQEAGRTRSRAERKLLAEQVRRAETPLSKAERREARRIVDQPRREAAARRRTRIHEDKLADIHTPWVVSQNVGRGKRS